MKTSNKLLKALETLELKGWCQGSVSSSGSVCALGALGATNSKISAAERTEAAQAVRRAAQVENISLWHWNDQPERTYDDVQAAFMAAALLAMSEESP